jgi:hypothetical protein
LEEVKAFALTQGKEGKKRFKPVESIFKQEKKLMSQSMPAVDNRVPGAYVSFANKS